MGLGIVNRNGIYPAGGKPRVYDRPEIIAPVYIQFANDLIKHLANKSEEYNGNKCLGMA